MNAPAISDAVADLRNKITELIAGSVDLINRAGRSDLAASLSTPEAVRGRRLPEDRSVVAVVGETSRGKSALVNALIGRPGLSPVDPQVTTCVPVLFTYADPEWARVWIHRGRLGNGQPEPISIAVAEIADYAHETRNPGNERMVQRVEVGVRSPVLDVLDVTIADTPGVGGLNSGHADLALAQLHTSDAVVLVLDAATEISPSEVRFLREAAAQVATVIIAITKTDLQFDMGRIIDVDRDRIRSEVPQLGEPLLIPVSSRLVELAEQLPLPDRDETRAASGINNLIAALNHKVRTRRERLDLAKMVGLCLQQLAHLDAHLVSAAAAVDDNELRKTLQANEGRLCALQQARAEWHSDLLARLTRIEGEVIGHRDAGDDTLRAKLDELGDNYRELAHTADAQDEFDKLVINLQAETVRACSRTSTTMEEAIGNAFEPVVNLGIAVSPDSRGTTEQIDAPAGDHKPEPVRDKSLVDYLKAISPAIGFQSLVITALGAWGLILVPPLAALAIRDSNVKARRRNFLDWVDRYLETVDGLARNACDSNIAAAKASEVRDKIDALLDAEIEATAASVKKQTTALTSDQKERADESRRVQSIVAELAARGGDAHHLLIMLTAEPQSDRG